MDIWIMSKFLWFWVSLRFHSHTTTFTHLVYSSLYDHRCNLWTFSSTCKEFLYILVFPAYHLSLHIYVLLNPTLYSTYIWTCTICHCESLVSFPEVLSGFFHVVVVYLRNVPCFLTNSLWRDWINVLLNIQ